MGQTQSQRFSGHDTDFIPSDMMSSDFGSCSGFLCANLYLIQGVFLTSTSSSDHMPFMNTQTGGAYTVVVFVFPHMRIERGRWNLKSLGLKLQTAEAKYYLWVNWECVSAQRTVGVLRLFQWKSIRQ